MIPKYLAKSWKGALIYLVLFVAAATILAIPFGAVAYIVSTNLLHANSNLIVDALAGVAITFCGVYLSAGIANKKLKVSDPDSLVSLVSLIYASINIIFLLFFWISIPGSAQNMLWNVITNAINIYLFYFFSKKYLGKTYSPAKKK